jgi:hypothetical protein
MCGVALELWETRVAKLLCDPFGGAIPRRPRPVCAGEPIGCVPGASKQNGDSRPAAVPEEREPQHTPEGVCWQARGGGRLRLAPPQPVHLRPRPVHGRANRQVRTCPVRLPAVCGGRSPSVLVLSSRRRYVTYFLKQVELLRKHGITPVCVFDGGKLPAKSKEEDERNRCAPRTPVARPAQLQPPDPHGAPCCSDQTAHGAAGEGQGAPAHGYVCARQLWQH